MPRYQRVGSQPRGRRLALHRAGEVVSVVVTPTLELTERNEDELTAGNELDDRLDAALEGVEAHTEAGGGFLAGDEEARHGLYRATHRTTRAGAGGRSPGRLRAHLGCHALANRTTARRFVHEVWRGAVDSGGTEQELGLRLAGG